MTYATYYGILSDEARKHGYALAVHGSLTRDFDLVAVPWSEEPAEWRDLIRALASSIGADTGIEEAIQDAENKPHGRKAVAVPCGAGGYMDISVVPNIGMNS